LKGDVVKVLVTGGTGHLGKDIVEFLKAEGHDVRILARTPGVDPSVEWVQGDLATGRGIPEAVPGAQTIIHAATLSPAAIRGYMLPTDLFRSPPEVDIDGTRRLLEAAERSDVEQFLYVSIVGVDKSRLPYLRAKFAAEELVRGSRVPWSIVRGTGFHWLLDRMLTRMVRLPVWPLPTDIEMQPVDSRDFAHYLVGAMSDGPGGDREDFGGPLIVGLGALAKQYQEARGLSRRIVRLPLPAAVRRAAQAMTCPDGRRGTTTWEAWLAHQRATVQGPESEARR
jgi:uncharacterized protein YbjT (DUF2867 family)